MNSSKELIEKLRTQIGFTLPVVLAFQLLFLNRLNGSISDGWEIDFEIGAESRVFFEDPAYQNQLDTAQTSVVIESEWYRPLFDNTWELTAIPFYRHDFEDNERTHFDLREFHFRRWTDWGAVTIGIQRVFWGVTESQHLVDIVNQTDNLENPDGEDKLGQPMVMVTWTPDWGNWDFFVLPGFRKREFPGQEGRLRAPLLVLNDPLYEHGRDENSTDLALRYNHYVGDFDFGLSYFYGNRRDPILFLDIADQEVVFRPFYETMHQFGADVQYTRGGWLWKMETIARATDRDHYHAITGGFEYTFVGIFNSAIDLGTLLEVHYDSEGESSFNPFNRDLFYGARLAWNDEADTALLVGGIWDWENSSQFFRAEFSRRIGQNYTLNIESQITSSLDERDPLFIFQRDSFVSIELRRYF